MVQLRSPQVFNLKFTINFQSAAANNLTIRQFNARDDIEHLEFRYWLLVTDYFKTRFIASLQLLLITDGSAALTTSFIDF
jgi:hypothetical protein